MARRPRHRSTQPQDVVTPAGKKKTYPDSLRWLLIMIREQYNSGMSSQQLAENLNEIGLRYSGRRARLTKSKIDELEEEGGTPPLYSHLEKYAHSVHMPTGLMLMFSLFVALQRDERPEIVPNIKRAVLEIFKDISDSTKFDVHELKRWSRNYAKHDSTLANRGTPLLHYQPEPSEKVEPIAE